MKHIKLALVLLLLGCVAGVSTQSAQTPKPRTPAQIVRDLIAATEIELTGVAAEMPEDKYEFAPSQGAFRGVRTFAKQVKHAAAVHHLVAATILGERITADMSDERGPDSVKTKAEVLKYLKDSFTSLNRAASTIDEKNAFVPIEGVSGAAQDTRMGLIMVALTHSSNHYGQIVEYLRMNGIVPPQSQ
jgi:uncharacterized damage-inducible protein DinB